MALVQWHPRLRRIMRNNRKFFLGVFLIFLFVFFASEHERGHIEGDARRSEQLSLIIHSWTPFRQVFLSDNVGSSNGNWYDGGGGQLLHSKPYTRRGPSSQTLHPEGPLIPSVLLLLLLLLCTTTTTMYRVTSSV